MEEDNNIFKEMLGALDELEARVDSFLTKKESADVKVTSTPADLELNVEEALNQIPSLIECNSEEENFTSYEDRENSFLLNFIETLIKDFPEDKKDLVRQDAIKAMQKTTF